MKEIRDKWNQEIQGVKKNISEDENFLLKLTRVSRVERGNLAREKKAIKEKHNENGDINTSLSCKEDSINYF